jgi:cytochrome c biogenesis protein CcdA
VLSFTAIGLFVSLLGVSLGLDDGVIRAAGAALLLAFGTILIVPSLQARFALATEPRVGWMARLGEPAGEGLAGQFGVGLLLGAVWAPCAGPSLGAAAALAAEGRDLLQAALTMLAFSTGAALSLAALGRLSRPALARWRGGLLAAGWAARAALGAVLLASGALILLGLDKAIEAALIDRLPGWLLELTARF